MGVDVPIDGRHERELIRGHRGSRYNLAPHANRRRCSMQRIAFFAVLFLSAASLEAQTLQEILDSKALMHEYNPVLVGFLLEEGKGRVTAKQQKDALDQEIARFREEIN